MATVPAAPTPSTPDRRAVLSALRGSIRPPAVPPLYTLALAAVGAAMVLLPLVYLALVGTTAWATYWHAVHDLDWLAGRGSAKGRLFVYATPLVAGVTTVLFLVKPLFARRAKGQGNVVLDRRREPFLYDFVDRLCRVLGAPTPERIEVDCDVNASARREGFAGTGGLVLTLGLPLVAGLTLRETAGVLAHEFGHFSQGAGMRLSGLIRGVNHWFARVVYERDSWDAAIERESRGEGSGSVILVVARLLVWLSRRVLQALMLVGHALSCALMRQMEHDADRYEALLAGSETFARTAGRLRVLAAAHQVSHQQLAETVREGRLAADLPRFVAARAAHLPGQLTEAIEADVRDGRTGWFDTHPCDRERIERTAGLRAPGLFTVEAPATVLFQDFDGLARRVSLEHYRQLAGEQVSADNLVPNESLVAATEGREETAAAFQRVTQGLVDIDHLVFPRGDDLPHGDGALVEAARAGRERCQAELPGAREAFRRLEQATERAINVAQAEQLLAAGVTPDPRTFHLPAPSAEGVARARQRAEAGRRESMAALAGWDAALGARLAAGLASLPAGPERDVLARALAGLEPAVGPLESLRTSLSVLLALLGHAGEEPGPALVQAIRSAAARTGADLVRLREGLGETPYPFAQGGPALTVAGWVVPELPDADDLQGVHDTAREALGRYAELHARLCGRVAQAVESLEGGPALRT